MVRRTASTPPNIIAIDGTYPASCPLVTFQFPSRLGGPLLVTLTLAEWQRVAMQIADAASAVSR